MNLTQKLDLDRQMLGMLIPEKLSPKLDREIARDALAPSLSSQAINKDKKRFLRLQKKIIKIKKRLDSEQGPVDRHVRRRSQDQTIKESVRLVNDNSTERLPELASRKQGSEKGAAIMQRSFSSTDVLKAPVKRNLRLKQKEGSRVDEMANTKTSMKNNLAKQMVVDMR